MNIFILDENIEKCAQYHCDQHVVKMIVESVQLLCIALNKKGFTTPYKSTHVKHPCVLCVKASYGNFLWLRSLSNRGMTEFAQAMPDKYKVPGDAVKAYRNFYLGEKWGLLNGLREVFPTG